MRYEFHPEAVDEYENAARRFELPLRWAGGRFGRCCSRVL